MTGNEKKKWTSPGFLIAAAILAVSAVGWNTAVSALKIRTIKEKVELRKDLSTLPATLGDWVQVSKDEPLDSELQETLDTNLYIFRDYVNTKLLTADELAAFNGKTTAERKNMVARLQAGRPEAVLNLAVTYYTGKANTVAHIPERCYVADGYAPLTHDDVTWDVGPGRAGKTASNPNLQVRYINFEDSTGTGRVTKRVAYFFFANGHYECDSLKVRQTLQDLWAKHAFYSKVELMGVIGDDALAQKTMANFLSAALPEIEKCWPDWNAVEHATK